MKKEKTTADITKELIEFKSTPENKKEIDKCLNYIKKYLKNTGAIIKTIEYNKVKSLFITYHKTKKPTILLNGHIDVVPAEDSQYLPYEKDGLIYGRGAVDMKGGVAACLKTFHDLQDIKPNIGLMIVTDEEIGGFNGSNYLCNQGYSGEFVIASEPTSFKNNTSLDIVVKEKGVIQLEIKIKGKSAHASRPWEGSNAIENLYETYNQIKQLIKCENKTPSWGNTINLGLISGGKALNQIPSEATMTIDIRHTEKLNPEKLLAQIKKLKHIKSVELLEVCPLLINQKKNSQYFIETLQKSANKYSETKTELIYEHAASDLRFFSDKKVPCALIGPHGANYHGLDEYVSIDGLNILYKTLTDFITTIHNQKK